ncbi:putative transcription factor bHLH041 isoform X1 [Typha latifolia]|uniref:putative transcription factor bHLH041 isoform X1 n=1 Tax=Typha latifolia TaxID=4733 RepID=UPI003C2E5C23
MDRWYYFNESEKDCAQRPFECDWGNLYSMDNDSGSAYGQGYTCFELGDANLMNSAANPMEQQFYQKEVQIKGCNSTGSIGFRTPMTTNQMVAQKISQPSSSLSSIQSLSDGSSDYSSKLSNIKANSYMELNNLKKTASKAVTQHLDALHKVNHNVVQLPSLKSKSDAAITRAMMAVISSTSSSSSSSPSVVSNPNNEAQVHGAQAFRRAVAFGPYTSSFVAKFEPKKDLCSQKMMKMSIAMLRRIDSLSSETRMQERQPANNQLHHVISERRRREKLNASFQELRMLLPHGSKKDKTSVLINAKNYLSTLEAQIYELQEKNRKLEKLLHPSNQIKDANGTSGGIQLQILKASAPSPELQHINVRITVRVECDIIELILHILECLQRITALNLLSVEAQTYSPQMNLFARASIKIQIKDCDWNEALFEEAMISAVDGMNLNSPLSSGISHPF